MLNTIRLRIRLPGRPPISAMLLAVLLTACGGDVDPAASITANDSAEQMRLVENEPASVAESDSMAPEENQTPRETQQVDLPVQISPLSDPLLENLNIPRDAASKGMWIGPIDWPLIAIHASLLPDGKVLTFGSPVNRAEQGARVFDYWEPAYGLATDAHFQSGNAQGVDSFCAAAAWASPGKLLISGGNSTKESTLLDSMTATAKRDFSLSSDRWYGSMITMADGRVLMTGGADSYVADAFLNPGQFDDGVDGDFNDGVAMTPEIYSPGTGWRKLNGATSRAAFGPDLNRYWYPRQWVAADGNIFGLSADQMWRIDADADDHAGRIELLGKFKGPVDPQKRPNIGASSSAVMFDIGRILQTGGNGYVNGSNSPTDLKYDYRTPSSRQATLIELGDGSQPSLRETAPMHQARQWHHSTVLPDGSVFVNGGTRFANYAGIDAVFSGEIWSPKTGVWQETAPASQVRVYHSSALLLPNGGVFTAGTGAPGPVNNFNAELFLPPYLFTATDGPTTLARRPVIVAVSSTQSHYGEPLKLQLNTELTMNDVVLTGLGNETHSFNSSQRRISLPFNQKGNRLTLELPESGAIAPPGYYLLFVLDEHNVPSTGVIISLYAPA